MKRRVAILISGRGSNMAALIEAAHGRPQRAACLAGASARLWQLKGRRPWEDSSLDTLFPNWRARPDHEAISQAYAEGQALSVEQAVALALDEKTDPAGY